MQQTDPEDYTELLEVFRLGLLTGVMDRQAIIAWADKLIMQEATPNYFLIELSLSGHSNLSDLISLLHEYVGENKPEVSKRVLLGLLFHRYQSSELTLANTIYAIDWLAIHLDYTTEEHSFMAGVDDEYRLATEGICGTTTEIENFVLRFLSIYQPFRLDNRPEWQLLSNEAAIRLDTLYHQLKTW